MICIVTDNFIDNPQGIQVASFFRSHLSLIMKLENSPRLWSRIGPVPPQGWVQVALQFRGDDPLLFWIFTQKVRI